MYPLHIFSMKLSRAVHTLVGDRVQNPTISNSLIISPPQSNSGHEWHFDEPLSNATFDTLNLQLLMLVLLSDVEEENSGTMFIEGSPQALAQQLKQNPKGVDLSVNATLPNKI